MASRNIVGVPVLLLGLTGESVTRIIAGEPIAISAADLQAMGLPAIEIGITYGRTNEDILAAIRGHGVTVREGPVPPPPGA